MKKSLMLNCTSFIILLALSQAAMAKSVGTVTFSAGDVTISHADKTVNKAEKNAELNAGDAIETKEGRVQLSMIDGGKISLQPNTIYKINQFEFTGKEDGSEYNFTELVKGGLRTISGLIGHKNRDHYQLKTAVATIGIRGTEFTVNFNDNNLLMTTNHGSVDVCNAGGCLNAMTGQSIQVAGFGGAPKPSNKAAKAAAAPPPAAGKAVFAAGEQINTAALTTTLASITSTVTPSPVVGNDTIVSLATMASGPDNNGVYKGTTTFSGNDLISYVDNSGTPNIVTGTIVVPNVVPNSDPFVKWGRASGGTYNGQNMLMSNWVTGIATPTAGLANFVGTYNVINSTAPYVINGGSVTVVGAANSVTGSMHVNFTALNWGYNLTIPVPGQVFNLTVANNIAGFGGSSLTAGSTTFNDSTGITGFVSPACSGGCSGLLAGGAAVQGSLFGPNAERAGLQYGIQFSGSGGPGSGGNLYGATVLKKQ